MRKHAINIYFAFLTYVFFVALWQGIVGKGDLAWITLAVAALLPWLFTYLKIRIGVMSRTLAIVLTASCSFIFNGITGLERWQLNYAWVLLLVFWWVYAFHLNVVRKR